MSIEVKTIEWGPDGEFSVVIPTLPITMPVEVREILEDNGVMVDTCDFLGLSYILGYEGTIGEELYPALVDATFGQEFRERAESLEIPLIEIIEDAFLFLDCWG